MWMGREAGLFFLVCVPCRAAETSSRFVSILDFFNCLFWYTLLSFVIRHTLVEVNTPSQLNFSYDSL